MQNSIKRGVLGVVAGFAMLLGAGRAALAATGDVDQRVDQMMSRLTLPEKISLLGGVDGFYTKDIKKIDLPRFKMSDGPLGTRNDGPSTAYPAGVLLASTWDPAIAQREGESLGRDARARGDHVLLGPAVNIYRVPMNGRNFEYMGEDPFLAGQMAVAYIKGVQSQGVAACVKHYACNNQETRRDDVDVRVDERTLHEIYLPAFEAAVREGHVRTIMAAYNKINGYYATANHYLLTDVLRSEWGFDGLAMSDWGAVHDTAGPMTAGLDLEMAWGKFLNEKRLQPLLDSGKVTTAMIDAKVRHLLHVAVEMGWLDRPQLDRSISRDDEPSDATALAVAREGIVLLKNDNNLLPLDRDRVRQVVVMGKDPDQYIAGGGSSYTDPTRPVTMLDGITAAAGKVQVTLIPFSSSADYQLSKHASGSVFEPLANGKRALHGEYFNGETPGGKPAAERDDDSIDFNWHHDMPIDGVTDSGYSARWTGTIKPTSSGSYTFVTRSDDGSRVKLDGKTIVDNWRNQGAHTESGIAQLEAGKTYQLVVEYYNNGWVGSMQFAYFPTIPMFTDQEKKTLAAADAAVLCVHTEESEGGDHAYALPKEQEELINATAALNPKLIVLLQAGSNVAMKNWVDHAAALVDAWFPGQAGGTAVGQILFGDMNPSGHLPDSFEKDWPEAPAYGHYPGGDQVDYAEGLYVGYRWFDKKKIEPRFPFGYGLSYTSFQIANAKVEPAGSADAFTVHADVTNSGKRPGATVVQCYVRPPQDSTVDRPVQELKGFARVELQPGQTQSITIPLNARSFSYWDATAHAWKVQDGEFHIALGTSSRDIATTVTASVKSTKD